MRIAGLLPTSLPAPVEEIVTEAALRDTFAGTTEQFHARRWKEAIRVLEHEARAGRLSAVILDLDNVLIRPKGFLGSEAQEHASVKSAPRSEVLKRRDRDERRMVAHGFFETAAGLRDEDLAALARLRDEYGVALIGATARPEKLRGRTTRMIGLLGVELDRLLFTGGTGADKLDQVDAALTELGLRVEDAIAVDDRADNIAAFARHGLRTIQYDHPDPNHATLTSRHYVERAEQTTNGAFRFEYLLNGWAVGSRMEKDAILRLAEERLTLRQVLRFRDAIEGLESIVNPSVLAPKELTAAEASWAARAESALLKPPADPPHLFQAASFVPAPAVADSTAPPALARLLGRNAIEIVARAIVDLDGRDLSGGSLAGEIGRALALATPHQTIVSAEAVEGFLATRAQELREAVREQLELRRTDDLGRLEQAMHQHPDLSLEELRRGLVASHPHFTLAYRKNLEADLVRDRDVDRLGEEPNLLLAAHAAVAILRGEKPALDSKRLAQLRAAYPFLPDPASALRLEELPASLRARLSSLESIPFASDMFREWHTLSGLPPVLEGSSMVTVDHALADKFAFYRHLIVNERARGSDIHVIWKPHSADPVMVDLAERSLGLSGVVARDDADIAALTRTRTTELARAPETRRMFVHLTGVKLWSWLDGLAAENPHVEINGVSHTTSDADELRGLKLEHTTVSVMADSEAKIRYERFMFAQSFERLLENLPDRFSKDLPDLEDRHVVIHGAAGKIIGSGVTDALLSMLRSSADGLPPFPKITLIDPAFADPEHSARKLELESAGFQVIAGTEIPRAIRGDKLLSINCTAGDVWSEEKYRSLETNDLVFMNLGTGQGGCAISTLEQHSRARMGFGPAGHQASVRYDLELPGEKQVRVYNLADGYPYNLTTRTPNPPFYSDFNNLLITMSLHHASKNRERGLPGAQVLDMANVSFTWSEEEGRPIVFLLPEDLPPDFRWPTTYDGAWFREGAFDPKRPVLFEDLRESGDVARFLSLLAEKERKYPGTVASFFGAKRRLAAAADPMIQHLGGPGPLKTVQVVDVPVRLLGPNCVLTSAPKSDLAGDIIGLRFTGEVPKFRTEASFGLIVEATANGVSAAVKPSLEHRDQPRRLKLLDEAGGMLLDLTIPIKPLAEEPAVDRKELLSKPPSMSFNLGDAKRGTNRIIHPGTVFKVTLPESIERWVPACSVFESAWTSDQYFELLDSRRIGLSRPGVPAMREMVFRVRPDALRMHGGETPAALSIFSFREDETYDGWSFRRGGSGADYSLNLLIKSP